MDYTIRFITDGGDLVSETHLGDVDDITAHAEFVSASSVVADGEIAQLIGDDLVRVEIFGG